MKLSVVILNYNVRYFLELCLRSVVEATKDIESEIIVVDNHSADDSCEMVKTMFPEVILIENKDNVGFSKGNNQAVRNAKGEYLCILNPDTVLPEDVFVQLLAFADAKEKVGIVGCRLVDGTGHFLPESKRNIPTPYVSLKKVTGFTKEYYANQLGEFEVGKIPVFVGAFMLIKRAVYNEVQGFDEDYFMYGEDVDLSYKVLEAGYDNYYNGTITAIHYKGESTLKDAVYARRFYGAMQIFYKKHFKKNILFNLAVWFGIRMAYVASREPKPANPKVNHYILVSDKMAEGLEEALAKKVSVVDEIQQVKPHTEIIFDANLLSFKKIIQYMCDNQINRNAKFKILSKNSTFILGSNSSKNRGKVILLEQN
ncbi:glycosyltransferase family 2 protein [Mangrovimonas sp. DI 80]|uniref:glycosyltransferase family 2 protein n=1 Tax=Mangrovimonas sp. DI 80 TaxID=1779330 RepID=UPI000978BE53|nr:glycosyltransferase family 2 protein [Mangrovimonas sp. DI 80]OMP31103.1 glycosyl transferase family 2 [Mangrovimonas sp. DI 80]